MSMYNKLFTKILDSSIWLESMPTRIVWLTFIAAMDEHGFCQFASVANVAHRARVSLQEAEEAIACLEGPDANSSDPDNDGRRLERVPGGWMVLNAEKHRAMVTRVVIKEQTRERVRKHRAEKRTSNAQVTVRNESVTTSEAVAEARSESESDATKKKGAIGGGVLMSPMEYVKRIRYCAYVGVRLEVPHKLHRDFSALLGGDNPDAVLRAWYADIDAELERTKEPIAPTVWKFLEARFKVFMEGRVTADMWAAYDAKHGISGGTDGRA